MKFELSKIKFGTNNKTLIAKLLTESAIKDICYIDNFGFVFIHGKLLGHINFSGHVNNEFIISNIDRPVSLCYSKKFYSCYILEENGKSLKYFELGLNTLIPFLGCTYKGKLLELLGKTINNDIKAHGCVDDNKNIYFMYDCLNKGLKFVDSEFKHFLGNGRASYCTSSDLISCMFNKPSGIAYYNGVFFVSDTGNHCIRKIDKNKIDIIVGTPHSQSILNSPTKINIKNKLGYFLDQDKIYYFTSSDDRSGVVYQSKNLISFDMDDNKNLYILETL
jgi:hypothetical protein